MQKILSFHELRSIVPFSRSHIYSLIAAGQFPAPLKLGKKRVGFDSVEIQKWRDGLPKAQIGGAA